MYIPAKNALLPSLVTQHIFETMHKEYETAVAPGICHLNTGFPQT